MSQSPEPTEPSGGPESESGLPGDREMLAPGVWVRKRDLNESFVRGSGPGGQSVNKVATAVLLRVSVEAIEGLDTIRVTRLRTLARNRITRDDEILIQSNQHRTQIANRKECLERLRALVIEAWNVPRPRRKTRPTKASRMRRLDEKRRQSEKKSRRRNDRSPDW